MQSSDIAHLSEFKKKKRLWWTGFIGLFLLKWMWSRPKTDSSGASFSSNSNKVIISEAEARPKRSLPLKTAWCLEAPELRTQPCFTNLSSYCGALCYSMLTSHTLPIGKAVEQLGQIVAAKVNYFSSFCLNMSIKIWQHILVFLDAAERSLLVLCR